MPVLIKKSRNKHVNGELETALKSNPSPIYKKSFAKRITTGNFEDDMQHIATCDWIIEVVIERLDIKKTGFRKCRKIPQTGNAYFIEYIRNSYSPDE